MADPCAEMVFHYKGIFSDYRDEVSDKQTSSSSALTMLQGPTRRYQRFITSEDFGIFGAYLYPYAIPDLFNLSSFEILHETPAIEQVNGSEGRLLTEQIMCADNNYSRADILSAYLLQKVNQNKKYELNAQRCIKEILFNKDQDSIKDIASKHFISSRQLERKFKTIAGMSPKTYARVTRFQHAMNSYGTNYQSLTEIAYKCGYYDQSHFIHDFREFSGYEPSVYFAGQGEGIEYRDHS
jgi:AraC-like DNA-binding protein